MRERNMIVPEMTTDAVSLTTVVLDQEISDSLGSLEIELKT